MLLSSLLIYRRARKGVAGAQPPGLLDLRGSVGSMTFNRLDYTLLSIAAAALGGIYLIRQYCAPLPLHKRAVVALKAKVLG
jgi:hypothetical protein